MLRRLYYHALPKPLLRWTRKAIAPRVAAAGGFGEGEAAKVWRNTKATTVEGWEYLLENPTFLRRNGTGYAVSFNGQPKVSSKNVHKILPNDHHFHRPLPWRLAISFRPSGRKQGGRLEVWIALAQFFVSCNRCGFDMF